MFHKNLKYYRLKNNLSKKELAALVNITPMAITYYETGKRHPNMEMIQSLAKVLNVQVSDFLNRRDENLKFVHGEFRKNSQLTNDRQEFIRESIEEYINRFYTIIDILGGDILPTAPLIHQIKICNNVETNALDMRKYLGIAEFGPVGNLIELLENKGIIVYICDIDNDAFSGMNGLINDRPYIIVNGRMSAERMRSTIAHELVHLLFKWPQDMENKKLESQVTAIAGAFLFPIVDAMRELGIRRTRITGDMKYICKEYGISMYLLVKRASLCHIINESAAKNFYIKASKDGCRKNEPTRIEKEQPMLFSQLVFRAVCENEISIQKGAELLQISYDEVEERCFSDEI